MTEKKSRRNTVQVDSRFSQVVQAFAKDRTVSHGRTKGFGAGALKVNDRIFAMLSSKGEFVVKLPKERVDTLVREGTGQRFDPGRRKLMKEWLVVKRPTANWLGLAEEACEFVKQGESNR